MSSPEERLRDVLRAEAATVVPAGDGLARIRERTATRRRFRLVVLPGAALVAAAAVVAVIALSGTTSTQRLDGPATQVPAATPTATTSTTATPTPGVEAPYTGPMLWPFTSVEQGQSWMADHGKRPWADNPTAVAIHLVRDLLKLDVEVVESGPPFDAASDVAPTITLKVRGQQVGVVHLVRVFRGGPWTVVSVCCTDLTVTSPVAGAAITTPTTVSGRVTGVDENVQLRLITATGRELATTGAPAGSEAPWTGTLEWTAQDWFTAGIVAVTRSLRDGSINRVTVVVVKRGRA